MRRLSTQLIASLQLPATSGELMQAIGDALCQVRGRPVKLCKIAFPPATASGLWIDRTSHDIIAYEENTEPEHQLVIVGHEAWHMFQGHCGNHTDHDSVASRALAAETTDAIKDLAALISDTEGGDPVSPGRMDAGLHFASRADASSLDMELEAEHFGIRFATDVQAAVTEASSPADPQALAGRIQVSMAHRFRRN